MVRGAALNSEEPLFFTYVSDAARALMLIEATGTNSSCPALLRRSYCAHTSFVGEQGEVSPVAPELNTVKGVTMVAGALVECSRDCMGLWGGAALFDDCGECSGGTTGKIANASKDCEGVCFGPFRRMDMSEMAIIQSELGENPCACLKDNSFQCSQMERRKGPATKAASLAVLDW